MLGLDGPTGGAHGGSAVRLAEVSLEHPVGIEGEIELSS